MMRRHVVQRLTSAVVGATIAAIGGVTIASLSGASIDLELAFIVGLAAMGGWLLLTAAVSAPRRNRVAPEAPQPPAEAPQSPAEAPAAQSPEAD